MGISFFLKVQKAAASDADMVLYAGRTQKTVTVAYVSSSALLADDWEDYSNEIMSDY